MPHIHTEPGQHDQTVSAYIVNLSDTEPRLLLHQHKLLHEWLQIGGHIELSENPWQAARHEIHEESGYNLTQLRLLQPRHRLQALSNVVIHPVPVSYLTHKFPGKPHFHTDIGFAFTTTEPADDAVEQGESAELRLFTRDELMRLKNIPEDVREIGLFVLNVCLLEWETVDPADF